VTTHRPARARWRRASRRLVRRTIRGFYWRTIWALARIVRPQPDRWAFVIHPGQRWSGNLRALADECIRSSTIKVVVLDVDGRSISGAKAASPTGIRWCRRPSVAFLRCGVICTSHGPFEPELLDSAKRKQYLLWHGVGFKNHGIKSAPWIEQAPWTLAGAIAASTTDQERMVAQFGLPPEKVWVTGYPRIQHIVMPRAELPPDLAAEDLRLAESLAGRRLILLAPTWEAIVEGRLSIQSILQELSQALPGQVALGLRVHPNARQRFEFTLPSGCLDLDSDRFASTEIVLRNTGLLLTDFSSIWVDFLVLHRPIVGVGDHVKHYIDSGRISSQFLEEFPGDWCSSITDLKSFVTSWATQDDSPVTYPMHLARYHADESHPARVAMTTLAADVGWTQRTHPR
jgi:hypothetical protein